MATSSQDHHEPVPGNANKKAEALTPVQQAASLLPSEPSSPEPTVTSLTTGTLPTAHQPAIAGIDVAGAVDANALSSMQHVIDLADSVVRFADRLHERILQEIASHNGHTIPDAQQVTIRALMDDELLLRQHAHALYLDAATFVIRDLTQPQHRLMTLTTEAAEKIRRIGVIGEAIGLVGGVLLLVGSITTGQFSQVGAALEKIQLHNATLKTLKPGLPPKA